MDAVFQAYAVNPRLLPDQVLQAFHEQTGVRFLREIPLGEVDGVVEREYRTRPEFYRAISDHIAGMTDSYCDAEYRDLVG
jgi:dGTP triphosphohydrolase